MQNHPSIIAVIKDLKKLTGTCLYCHFDGMILHNGILLKTFYTDPKRIQHLLELGSLVRLRPLIYPKSNHHSYDYPEPDTTLAYVRDLKKEPQDYPSYTFKNLKDLYQLSHRLAKNPHIYVYHPHKKDWYLLTSKFKLKTYGKDTQ